MCNGTLFTVVKISPRAGIELGPLGYGRGDRREYQNEDQDGLYKNKKQNVSHRAQSKEYEITRSMKLSKYPKHDAYLFHRARDIRQLT